MFALSVHYYTLEEPTWDSSDSEGPTTTEGGHGENQRPYLLYEVGEPGLRQISVGRTADAMEGLRSLLHHLTHRARIAWLTHTQPPSKVE